MHRSLSKLPRFFLVLHLSSSPSTTTPVVRFPSNCHRRQTVIYWSSLLIYRSPKIIMDRSLVFKVFLPQIEFHCLRFELCWDGWTRLCLVTGTTKRNRLLFLDFKAICVRAWLASALDLLYHIYNKINSRNKSFKLLKLIWSMFCL